MQVGVVVDLSTGSFIPMVSRLSIKIRSGLVVHILRTILFIPRHRSIEIFSLTGNLRKLYLSVRTFMSIENGTKRNACLSVRTSTKKGTNKLEYISQLHFFGRGRLRYFEKQMIYLEKKCIFAA